MLNFFNKKLKASKKIDEFSLDEKKILIASILIECAKEDGNISEDETHQIKLVLIKKLKLSDKDVKELISEAIQKSNERVELYSITKSIRDKFSHEEILDLFVSMWEIILIDNIIDDFEAGLMTKLVGLFHLTGRESSNAKEIAKKNLNIQ
tara:strand:- start:5 stop:457 length:453 start_codon:yes stop_codon:yes gene_type:complete